MGGRLEGRVAVVTGAGAGIGRAIAVAFAGEGAFVHVSDLDGAAAEATLAAVREAGGEGLASGVDVTVSENVAALLGELGAGPGRIDVLVNNAGLNVRADFRHMSDADWEKIRSTNLDSVVRLSRDALGLLKVSGNAAIINLSSIMASRSTRQLAGYAATKGAISALSRSLAVEYAAFGIRVNFLCPGFIETALTERVLRNPMIADALIGQTPLRRFGTPEDVARAAVFLASDDAAFITGEGLAVDGGMAAHL